VQSRKKIVLTELERLEERAMTPLLDKLNLLSLGAQHGQLAHAYNITMRLVQMIEHL